jgi:hypothetical protein
MKERNDNAKPSDDEDAKTVRKERGRYDRRGNYYVPPEEDEEHQFWKRISDEVKRGE